jgi:hypothetical protein
MDEQGAQLVAEELIHYKENSSGVQSQWKQNRAKLLDWMIQNERAEIDVGFGVAEVRQSKESVKPNDALMMTLRDEPYNWNDDDIEALIFAVASTKEHIAENKSVLKIRLAKPTKTKTKNKTSKRKRCAADLEEDQSNGEEPKRKKQVKVKKEVFLDVVAVGQEMDVKDITEGRSRPHFEITEHLGPIRTTDK